jgi:hypothetical protein
MRQAGVNGQTCRSVGSASAFALIVASTTGADDDVDDGRTAHAAEAGACAAEAVALAEAVDESTGAQTVRGAFFTMGALCLC